MDGEYMMCIIEKKYIEKAKEIGVCEEAIDWLEEKPRTWTDLKKQGPGSKWYFWALTNIEGCPVSFDGLSEFNQARLMAYMGYGEGCPLDPHRIRYDLRDWVLRERAWVEKATPYGKIKA